MFEMPAPAQGPRTRRCNDGRQSLSQRQKMSSVMMSDMEDARLMLLLTSSSASETASDTSFVPLPPPAQSSDARGCGSYDDDGSSSDNKHGGISRTTTTDAAVAVAEVDSDSALVAHPDIAATDLRSPGKRQHTQQQAAAELKRNRFSSPSSDEAATNSLGDAEEAEPMMALSSGTYDPAAAAPDGSGPDDDDKKNSRKTSQPWTNDEDAMLRRAVQKLGAKRWSAIALEVHGRTGKQCRLRW